MPKGKPNKKYTAEFKRIVVEAVRNSNMSYNEADQYYEISHGKIQKWERIYLTEGAEGFEIERRGRGRSSPGRSRKLPKDVECWQKCRDFVRKMLT